MGEQGTELEGGTTHVEVRKLDSYERAVPAPLVRIKLPGGTGPPSHVVLMQDLFCPRSQLFVLLKNSHLILIPSRITGGSL